MMRISMSACKQPQPLLKIPGGLISMDQLIVPRQRRKDKVVVVMGATGTGKSRLSIDLATRFDAEVVNSDKMQVYKGLSVITNKVTDEECRGVPHHLLGFVDSDTDFSAQDFAYHASLVVDDITNRGRLPIVAGGSNSCIKALVCDDKFRSKYELCVIWVDASMPVLHSFVSKRVDQMVCAGLVEEARDFFEPSGDYSRGIRRAIGVPEMHEFFRAEAGGDPTEELLESGINKIKENTCKLACTQLQNILRLCELLEWRVHRVDATEAFQMRGEEAEEAWELMVAGPSTRIVAQFHCEDQIDIVSTAAAASVILTGPTNAAAVAAATH